MLRPLDLLFRLLILLLHLHLPYHPLIPWKVKTRRANEAQFLFLPIGAWFYWMFPESVPAHPPPPPRLLAAQEAGERPQLLLGAVS